MTLCMLCPRKCGADRTSARGRCGVGDTPRVAKVMLHQWEEPIVSGTNGAGAVFFSGCNLRCAYCQNRELSHGGYGKDISVERLADIFAELEGKGAHNIDLVTPTHYADKIIRALDIYRPALPIVYNCGGYESVDTLKALEGYVDVYLPDFKYADDELAARLSGAPDYFEVCAAAIEEMLRQTGGDIIENGLMKRGVLVRHLVIPSAIDNTFKAAEWLKAHYPKDGYISVMSQYLPIGDLPPRYSVRLKPVEYKLALSRFTYFENAYIQDMTSSSDEYVPEFDMEGV